MGIDWGAARDLSLTRDVFVDRKYPIGLYSLSRGGVTVPALSLDPTNSVLKARSFYTVASFDGWNEKYLKKVRRVQAYLAESKDLGSDKNAANVRALQIAIWKYLGAMDTKVAYNKKVANRKSYVEYIADVIKKVEESSSKAFKGAPYWLTAAMATEQHFGWLSARVLLQDQDGDSVSNQEVTIQTVGSSDIGATNSDGVATFNVRNPAPGRDQAIRVTWRGAIPAGTVLAASGYPRKSRSRHPSPNWDYIITTSPTPARLSLIIHHFANACS